MPATVRFDEFMRRALYDPRTGYYARRIPGIGGGRGDFTTAPQMGRCFARAVAAWAARALRECGCRDLIECGPGTGALAAAVWRELPWMLRLRTRLHLVETSEPLAQKQRATLGSRARWHTHPSAALAACGGRAVIFSNELVDAFPVRLFRKLPDGWEELYLETGDPPREVWREVPGGELPPSSALDQKYPDGQRVEVHDSYRGWLDGWLPQWAAGRMLTVDYGAPVESLYHRRPRGTLRGYLLNQRVEGAQCYLNPGCQDLTADVNFTDLAAWAAPAASVRSMVTLADFIAPFADPESPADRFLLDPCGAGGAFQVLGQNAAGHLPASRASSQASSLRR